MKYPISAIGCLILAISLMLPSLYSGFAFDDFFFLSMLKGSWPVHTNSYDLFSLIPGDPQQTQHFIQQGHYPWWTSPELKISFLRPLSSFLMSMDYILFGENALLYHLHSILWLALLFIAFTLLQKMFLPIPVAVLALFLLALDDSHGMATYWISNRNALVGAVPCFFGLYAHIIWRSTGWTWCLVLSVLGYAVGLFGSEMALSACAYIFSYEMFETKSTTQNKLKALIPLLSVIVIYFLLYRVLDKGASGSGFYIDPNNNLLAFLGASLMRIPVLVGDLIWKIPADLWFLSEKIRYIQAGLGILGAVVLFSLFQRLTKETKERLNWLLWGSILSLVPVVATMPSSRQLLCASFGMTAVVATVLMDSWQKWQSTTPLVKIQNASVMIGYLILSPALLLYSQIQFSNIANNIASLPIQNTFNYERKSIVLTAPDHVIGVLYPVLCHHFCNEYPTSWYVLSMAPYDHIVQRKDSNTLELSLPKGSMLTSDIEIFWRSKMMPYKPGDTIKLDGLSIEVLETRNNNPIRIAYRFDHDLNNSPYDFLIWKDGGLQKIAIPQEGEKLYLKKEPGPTGL